MDHVGTLEKSNTMVMQALNKQVANLNVMYVKLHHFHWYVKGPHFYTLHEKFEEMYDEITAYMDEVAERLFMIGGSPISTMAEYLKESSIQEASGGESAEQMISEAIHDYTMMLEEIKQGIKEAEQARDMATADLFTQMQASFEKNVWMLKSFLGQ